MPVPRRRQGLVYGDKQAPIQVSFFADPCCPDCNKMWKLFKEVLKKVPQMNVSIFMLALPFHTWAYTISQVVLAVKELSEDKARDLLAKILEGDQEKFENLLTAIEELKARVGIKKTIKDHKRILFNGNGYDDAWIKEAVEVRGLSNYPTTPDCMPHLLDEKNVKMLTSHKVFSVAELESRCEIMLENYCKTVVIEANTMVDMARKEILPAVEGYASELAGTISRKRAVSAEIPCGYETSLLRKLSVLADQMSIKTDELEAAVQDLHGCTETLRESEQIRDVVLGKMAALRAVADEAETQMPEKYWPFPTYGELLFGVR